MGAGAAYFGSRILRHVAADMESLAARGFTGVLHTFTENDLAYYREAFALGHFGTGAAIAVVLFCVLLALSIAYLRIIGKEART